MLDGGIVPRIRIGRMNAARLQELVHAFAGKRVAVVGDIMLDEFIWGKVGRISPEAPVPVVEVVGESFYPGGAANVARNLRQFIEQVAVIGITGTDGRARQLLDLLAEEKIDTQGVRQERDFCTIVKTRIIARQQQVVRVDRERLGPPSSETIGAVAEHVGSMLLEMDAVIFEDYGKGFLSQELVARVCAEARKAGKIVTADPNPRHPIHWPRLTAVKPNRAEAFLAAGVPLSDPIDPPTDDHALLAAGAALLEKWEPEILLVTLGEQGMILFRHDEPPHHIPTRARQVFDVSGAGDTAIALFTLALTGDASATEAAEIANHASAVVVGKLGTATLTPAELFASFDNDEPA